jgi:protein TonB
MVKSDKYFYLSGLLSFSLFLFFLGLFVTIVLSQEKLKQFALKKDNYISVSINTPHVTSKPVKKSAKPEEKKPPIEIKKEEPKPIETPIIKPQVVNKNISDLFASVKTQKIAHKQENKPVIDKKLLSKLANKSEKKVVTSSSVASSMLKKIEISSQSASTSPDVNEFLAKIQAIIYDNFYPPMNSEGYSAVISIELDSFGKMTDYRVITYSGNDMFNKEVDMLKRRLESLTFAKHPEGKSEKLKIILTSQE